MLRLIFFSLLFTCSHIQAIANHYYSSDVAVLVDSYSVGNFYPLYFKIKGLQCIHVQTSKEILPIFQKAFKKELYLETVTFDGDLNHLINSLKKYHVKCVIPGLDPGVELADQLSASLGLQTNGTKCSSARRNKHHQAMKLQASGLPTPKFCKFTSWDKLISWMTVESIDYPVVLKPLDSGGTDGVFICKDEMELRGAYDSLIGHLNALGRLNSEVLAQSFLDGEEYVVNSVSLDGQAYIVGIIESRKHLLKSHSYIYDNQVMLDKSGERQDALANMHCRVLKALEINHGPAHGEYMFTKDGPILIEIAARVSGGAHVLADNESVGCNQIDLTVDAYIDHESFRNKTKEPYEKKKHFHQVFLIASEDGIAKNTDEFIEKIKSLPSYFDHKVKISDGMKVPKTIDLISSPGSVFLIHEDEKVLSADYKAIRDLEIYHLGSTE